MTYTGGSGNNINVNVNIIANSAVMTATKGGSMSESIQAQLQANCAELDGLGAGIAELIAKLQAETEKLQSLQEKFEAEKPVQGKKEDDEDFKKRLAEWQSNCDTQLNAVQQQIASIQMEIQSKMQQMDKLMAENVKLQSELPAAQADDARRAEQARAQAQKALDAANQAISASQKAEPDTQANDQIEDNPAVEARRRERYLQANAPDAAGIPEDKNI
ncbi:MAG: hypothetical protein JW841_05950 [Deltaproteobacteria bacterium]|nr:hypothetical protein [Deltaproteobacteria bacterium]